ARTTPRASCLTLGVLSLVLRVPQHTAYPYIYQMVSVCIIEDNSALVSVWFLNAAEDRVFCMAFTQFLASSVTAKIAARMPSWRTGTCRKLRRLSASSSVSSMVIMTADPPRLADDGVHAPPRRWCLRPRRSEVQRVRRSAPHLVGPAQVKRISARLATTWYRQNGRRDALTSRTLRALPWRTKSTSRYSRRAWTPGTSGVTRTPTSVRTSQGWTSARSTASGRTAR